MLSWITGKVLNAGNWAFRRDIDSLSTQLLALSRDQIGLVAMCVAKVRHDIGSQTGANLLQPDRAWASHPNLASTLESTIKSTPNTGPMVWMNLAARVWLQTLRGLSPLSDPQTRAATKKIWMALEPGFEAVEIFRNAEISSAGQTDIPSDFRDLPEGLD